MQRSYDLHDESDSLEGETASGTIDFHLWRKNRLFMFAQPHWTPHVSLTQEPETIRRSRHA
jgi:hypothetical protein